MALALIRAEKMEIKKVIKIEPSAHLPGEDNVVEVSFIFEKPDPQRPLTTQQEEIELLQRYERDAGALLDFIRSLPYGTVNRLLGLIQQKLSYITPTPTADA